MTGKYDALTSVAEGITRGTALPALTNIAEGVVHTIALGAEVARSAIHSASAPAVHETSGESYREEPKARPAINCVASPATTYQRPAGPPKPAF